jgi:hypothetical protein
MLRREERQAVARRIFEALCAQYPDRYVALVEPENPEPGSDVAVDAGSIPDPLAKAS